MNIQVCARCKKRPAVVFVSRTEGGKTVGEGLCLVCAKELGIKPVDDILKKMGMPEDAIVLGWIRWQRRQTCITK